MTMLVSKLQDFSMILLNAKCYLAMFFGSDRHPLPRLQRRPPAILASLFSNLASILARAKIELQIAPFSNPARRHSIAFQFLAPYSCNLNPIENVFGVLKGEIRKKISTVYRPQIQATNSLEYGQKTFTRNALLRTIYQDCKSVVTQQLVSDCWAHAKTFLPVALRMENL